MRVGKVVRMRPSPRSVNAIGLCLLAALVQAGCQLGPVDLGAADELLASDESYVATSEGFESGSKGSYAAADVALPSGTWNMDDALIGTLAADRKVGTKAVRVRGSGRLTMEFDRSGAGTFTVKYGTYGSDSNGTFALYLSQNGGSSWTQVGQSVTTSATLSSASFTVNKSGTIRFQLRKTDGSSSVRINFDDVAISDFGDTPPPDDGGGGGDDDGGGDGASVSKHTKLGLPSPATTSNWNDYLSVKSQYVISYNSARKVPNWVSWELNSSYLGNAPRQDDYRTDSTLPSSMPQAKPSDYSGSGWDRGHMCPSADRTATTSANSQTFLLSQMLPQASNNNAGPWAKLEQYTRDLAENGNEVMVISGGVYGTGSSAKTIGAGVSVPVSTWKVVVVLDGVADGPDDVTAGTRVIGVLVPNSDAKVSTGDSWQKYRVSVRSIEGATQLDFLSDVSQSVQDVVETRVDNE